MCVPFARPKGFCVWVAFVMDEESLSMATTKYSDYSGSSNSYDNVELKFTPHASVEAEVDRTFGTAHPQYGQSFGVVLTESLLTDGALFYDAEKNKYKLFSVGDAGAMPPEDAIARGADLTVDDIDETLTRTYFGNTKTYDLVAARVEGVVDEDGETVIEATSKSREIENVEDGVPAFTEWEYHDGEPIEIPDSISWFSGNEDYGPSVASMGMVRLLTENGEGNIVDEDDLNNWLANTSGDDMTRGDIEGRRLEVFLVRRPNDDGNPYNSAVVVDADTGERLRPNNRAESESGSGNDQSSDDSTERATDSYTEPVAEFINTVNRLDNMGEERATKLLDEVIADPDTAFTEEDAKEAGGREAVLSEALN